MDDIIFGRGYSFRSGWVRQCFIYPYPGISRGAEHPIPRPPAPLESVHDEYGDGHIMATNCLPHISVRVDPLRRDVR